MTPANFCYWLQGFFEIAENSETKDIQLTQKQIDVIRAHLNLVFFHVIDPENLKDKTPEDKAKYQKIHDGSKSGEAITAEDVKKIFERISIDKAKDELDKTSITRPFDDWPKSTFDETYDPKKHIMHDIQYAPKITSEDKHKHSWIPDYEIRYNC